jgi:hypothetical protein
MNLPFLKQKIRQEASIPVQHFETKSKEEDKDSEDSALIAAAQDIVRAIESKDFKHLAMAIRSAFQILDSEEHVEGPHTNEGEE